MEKILGNSGDKNVLFYVVDKLLHRNMERLLLSTIFLSEMTNRFVESFINKIYKIRADLDQHTMASTQNSELDDTLIVSCRLDRGFSNVTADEIESIINKTKHKSCSLDPIPTTLKVLIVASSSHHSYSQQLSQFYRAGSV